MKKNNLFAILIIAFMGFGFISFANPTTLPPGGNKPTPINVLSTPQSKTGTLYVGDYVNRVLGIRSAPGSNETLSVSGGVVIGSSSSPDVFAISSAGTEMGNTTICQKTHTYTYPSTGTCGGPSATNSADGIVNISSLAGSGTRSLCIQQASISGITYNKVVICP